MQHTDDSPHTGPATPAPAWPLLRLTLANAGLLLLWWLLYRHHDAERAAGFGWGYQALLAGALLLTLAVWVALGLAAHRLFQRGG